MNIGTLLPRHARYRPEHLALVFGEQRYTYCAFNAYVNRLANALLASGLRKGDKLATVLPNSVEMMAAYWAAAKTGIVIVPCSPLLQDSGLVTLLNDADAAAVLADAPFADTFGRIRGDLPAIQADRYILVGGAAKRSGFQDYADWVANASEENPPDADLKDDDLYSIMYSSGTTGAPKGIVHTHYVRSMYCTLFGAAWRMMPESVVLHAGSIVFNGAMVDLMPWMFYGCTYILHHAFDAEAVIRDIKQEKVTHIIMVPTQIVAVLNSPNFDPQAMESLEMVQNVGAPLHLEHKKRLNEALPGRFYELYGLTEGCGTVLDKHDAMRKAGSVGAPPPFWEIRILNEQGRDCKPGEVGEICGRSPVMTTGYYKRPDLTAKAIVNGWLHTGDAGYLDEEGYLYLVDRIKDMIITGGVNVYPKDIEEVVIRHPDVVEVAVFGLPDEKWGETPVAAVTLKADAQVTAAELKEWANSRVAAKYQRLSDVLVMEAFPRNVAGKVLKREMREQFGKTV